MNVVQVGKREFIQHTSKYLGLAESREVIITHHNKPCLKIVPVHPKTISDLAGILENIKIIGDINDPILPGYDQWSS